MASGQASTSPRSRFRAHVRHGLVLTERDERLLIDLFHHRLMKRSHIVDLGYFGSTARANARLRLLFDHKLVARQYWPARSYGAEALYSVAEGAAGLLTERLGLDQAEVAKICRRGVAPHFVPHTLRVADLRVGFLNNVPHGASVERTLSESQVFHEYAVPHKSKQWEWHSLRPDAYMRLRFPFETVHAFVECDLGHTAAPSFKATLEAYSEYLARGIFRETYSASEFFVLTVTTGERRLKNLERLVPKGVGPAFLFTTFERFEEEGPYADIWSPGSTRLERLEVIRG